VIHHFFEQPRTSNLEIAQCAYIDCMVYAEKQPRGAGQLIGSVILLAIRACGTDKFSSYTKGASLLAVVKLDGLNGILYRVFDGRVSVLGCVL
jgi:hypothetical protein